MVRIFPKSRKYIDEIKKTLKVSDDVDKHKLNKLYFVHSKLEKSRRRLSNIRIFFFVALYASILSSFTSIVNHFLPVLSSLINYLFTLFGIIGTTISIIMIAILTHTINTFNRDITVVESHIISIYVKNDKSSKSEFDSLIAKIH